MERIPLLWQEETVGEMTVETAGLYTCFSCACRLPGEGLWHVWLSGEGGELQLGLLEPAGETGTLRRKLSLRSWGRLGTLRCARRCDDGARCGCIGGKPRGGVPDLNPALTQLCRGCRRY